MFSQKWKFLSCDTAAAADSPSPLEKRMRWWWYRYVGESFSFFARAAHRRAEKYDDDDELEARLVCFMWFSQFPLVSLFMFIYNTLNTQRTHILPDLNSSSSIDDELWFKVFSVFFFCYFLDISTILSSSSRILPTSSSRGKTYSTLFYSPLLILFPPSCTHNLGQARFIRQTRVWVEFHLHVYNFLSCALVVTESGSVSFEMGKNIERMKSKVLSEESNYGIHSLVCSLSTLPLSSSSSRRHTMLLQSEWKGGRIFKLSRWSTHDHCRQEFNVHTRHVKHAKRKSSNQWRL